eukprot:COSAG06_NODE_115_length_23358_cov_31.775227_5_plen_166_part_00
MIRLNNHPCLLSQMGVYSAWLGGSAAGSMRTLMPSCLAIATAQQYSPLSPVAITPSRSSPCRRSLGTNGAAAVAVDASCGSLGLQSNAPRTDEEESSRRVRLKTTGKSEQKLFCHAARVHCSYIYIYTRLMRACMHACTKIGRHCRPLTTSYTYYYYYTMLNTGV